MKKLLFCFLLIPLLSFAQEDWEYVGSSTNDSKYYIRDTQKKDYGDRIEFWSKIIIPNKTVKTKKGNVIKKGDQYLTKYEVDCSDKTMKKIIIAIYDSNGNAKNTDLGPYFSEPVIPDSMGEALLITACNKVNY